MSVCGKVYDGSQPFECFNPLIQSLILWWPSSNNFKIDIWDSYIQLFCQPKTTQEVKTTFINIKYIFTYIQTTIIKLAQCWGYKTIIYFVWYNRESVREEEERSLFSSEPSPFDLASLTSCWYLPLSGDGSTLHGSLENIQFLMSILNLSNIIAGEDRWESKNRDWKGGETLWVDLSSYSHVTLGVITLQNEWLSFVSQGWLSCAAVRQNPYISEPWR